MSKFCQNCGKALGDADRFCDGCGASQEVTPVSQPAPQPVQAEAPQPVQQAPVATAPETPKAPKVNIDVNKIIDQVKTFANGVVERCKADKKYLYTCAGIAGGAVLVLVLLLALVFGGNGGMTKPIDTLIDVAFKGKIEKITDLAPEEYWDYLEEEYDVDIDDILDEAEDSFDDMMDTYEDEYGDNIRVSYKVEDKKKLSDKKLEGIAEALADEYDLDEDDFTEAYELDVEMTIKGSEDDDDQNAEITVIKYKGKWYAISWYKYDGEYSASFMTDF